MEKPTTYSGKDYPIQELTAENFEKLCYELLTYSPTLKDKINYTHTFYKIGGRDQAKDGVIYSSGKVIGITQSKHSENAKKAMNSAIITNEILKMLLYAFIYSSKIEKYVFFVSTYVTEKTNTILLNFIEEFLTKATTKEKVEKVIASYVSLKNNDTLKTMSTSEIIVELCNICENIEMYFYYNEDIQTFFNECPSAVKCKYFDVKVLMEKTEKYQIPLIDEEELKDFISDRNYMYKKERYREKLIEIDISDLFLQEACNDFYSRSLAIIKLHDIAPIGLDENIKEYEKRILEWEQYEREGYKLNIESSTFQNYNEKFEGKKYYTHFIRNISSGNVRIELRNFELVTIPFTRGTIHELVNDEKIKNWLIKIKEEK